MADDVRLAAARLARALREDEREIRPSRGRLIEKDEVVRTLERGRYSLLGHRSLSAPRMRSERPSSDRGVTFHFALTHLSFSKPRSVASLPRRPDRVWVFPGRGERAAIEALGGRYDRSHRAWHVPSDRAAQAAQYRTSAAQSAWARPPRTSGGSKERVIQAAMDFQRYIERSDLSEEEKILQVVHDDEGPVSFGSLGEDVSERARFWGQYAVAADRINARIQSRIIIEIPHEVGFAPDGPRRVRALARSIAEPLVERSLPYHVAAHWPEVEKGSDSRNVHLHVLYGERVTERTGPGRWTIGRVDRSARGDGAGGGAWTAGLRDRYATALNAALAGIGAEKRYDPRSYAESGVERIPGSHLGPRRTQLERSGVPTAAGVATAERQRVAAEMEMARRQVQRRAGLADLIAASSGIAGDRVVRVMDRLDAAERADFEDRNGRRSVRSDWLTRQRIDLHRQLAAAEDERQRKRLRHRLSQVEAGISAMRRLPPGEGGETRNDLEEAKSAYMELVAEMTSAASSKAPRSGSPPSASQPVSPDTVTSGPVEPGPRPPSPPRRPGRPRGGLER